MNETPSSQSEEEGSDEEGSDVEGCTEPSDGMPASMPSGKKYPVAFTRRGDQVSKGTIAAILPLPRKGEWMENHPFWIVRVIRLTRTTHTLQYYGDQFLKPYYPLSPPGRPKADYVESFPAGSITFLHWDIQMVKAKRGCLGVPSAGDLRVLSLDQRICWQLPEHEAKTVAAKKRKETKQAGPQQKKRA